ncbi:helix-turn-helix domain-containing protein [Saccharothrix obliqua]|uniref:helix-turn-helix domain-containing protein n=1 Tax=Saccharothrix obliqua TaxID=2861747 RepID=UPI001C5DA9C3|nr:helix-turn-helix transcriptional regulator [Saccharothrix obliqua]MBW4716697.1 helix-turn-helix transcriptional regulator [Saccharothrix obliqua]
MTAKLDYSWNLRKVMADRGMFSTTDLRPLLVERGIVLSASQVYRLVVDKPERLNLKVLVALMDILDCQMTDLVEPIAARAAKPRKAASGSGGDTVAGGLGTLRPKRARIVPE